MAYFLKVPRCPCYCGGDGFLKFVACPSCEEVLGECDEVGELIRDVLAPQFNPEDSGDLSWGDSGDLSWDGPCPKCGAMRRGDFRDATEDEIRWLGFRKGDYFRRG